MVVVAIAFVVFLDEFVLVTFAAVVEFLNVRDVVAVTV